MPHRYIKMSDQTRQTQTQIRMSRASIYAGAKAWVSLCLVDTAGWHCSVASRISLQRHTFTRHHLHFGRRDVKAFNCVKFESSCCVIALMLYFWFLRLPFYVQNTWSSTIARLFWQTYIALEILQHFQRLFKAAFSLWKYWCLAWAESLPVHCVQLIMLYYLVRIIIQMWWWGEHGGMNNCLLA